MKPATSIRNLILYTAVLALCAGCGRNADDQAVEEGRRTEDMSQGQIHIEFRIEPARVHYDSDTLLTIAFDVPSQFDIELPSLHDRLHGFSLQGTYTTDTTESGGRKQWDFHARLTPNVSSVHRIAPMAVAYINRGKSPPETHWLATRAVELETVPPVDTAPGAVHADVNPVWIAPSFWTVATWVGMALLLVAVVIIAVKLAKRLHKEAVLRRLSPRERAMRELEELLNQHLVEKDRVKDFYVELTMIVRRYIERAHGVRAPEQTTEEFLAAVHDDSRFTPAVVSRLRDFLVASDLVKFAAVRPDAAAVDDATRTARAYVEVDATEQEQANAHGDKGGE